jgi:flagellar hook-associated protein 2
MTSVPAYQASGLASKLDTQNIIDNLVLIEGTPLKTIASKQADVSVQISAIGSLISSLDTLNGAAASLKAGGLTSISASGNYTDFSVSGIPANAGRFTVKVEDLARAAKTRSTATYTSADDVVTNTAKTLKLSVDGQEYDIDVAANTKLSDLATQINNSTHAYKPLPLPNGTPTTLPFTAAVTSDGTNYFLTISNKSAGFVVGQGAASALAVVNDGLGVAQDLGLGLATPPALQATNAVVDVDGLRLERRSNSINDAIGGVTLNLKTASNTNADLVYGTDTSSSQSKLQYFVDAYNKVATFLQGSLDHAPGTQSSTDQLSGTITMGLQRRLQTILSTAVNATGGVRTLRDLGVRLTKDGTAEFKTDIFAAALAKDPTAANTIFTKATTGIGDAIATLVKSQNDTAKGTHDTANGALVSRRAGLQATTKDLTAQAARLQLHLDAYRAQLNIQFTALEQVMNGINSTASFLDQQSAQLNRK